MPETAVKTPVCDICGAEVRTESLFCYNCGGSVSGPAAVEENREVAEYSTELATVAADSPGNGHSMSFDPAARREEKAKKRNVRASNRQPVEIVWEARTGIGWPFIIGSTLFILIAIALFLTAFYIR